jgi:AmmeMemoRadiSam system radical SAM enzyme/AmmeMemoRadiSam system protein B/AmmeMemoRadiSam system protein A
VKNVILPPTADRSSGVVSGGWWHESDDGHRIVCDLCPRACSLKPGDRGFCFVRQNVDGDMRLTTYGRSTGFCIDPIEKKPLNHFYPGTAVLSFGTAGCNLGCQFCQNWDISKSREVERLSELALPEQIAEAALKTGCRSVAFTYNDPVIWAEYAIDTANACRNVGLKSVAVTAGYILPGARPAFFHAMDAANVDLKGFTDEFYERITYSKLQPVLETLKWLKHESNVWFEITNLIIPSLNDSPDELRQMCDWIVESVGPDVPVHFSAFHPDFRMMDKPRTPAETLFRAHEIAGQCGLNYAYVGNIDDASRQTTWCPNCRAKVIERRVYQLTHWGMKDSCCTACGTRIPGHFDDQPGNWGSRRQPIRISDYARESNPLPILPTTSIAQSKPMEKTPSRSSSSAEAPDLSVAQESEINAAACEIVTAAVHNRKPNLNPDDVKSWSEISVMGVFVTLKRNGKLRGCCGVLGEPMPLLSALSQSGYRTALEDHRFPPVTAQELPHQSLDVSLLFHFQTITEKGEDRINAVDVGRHGLKIVHAGRSGLLLPIVPIEHGWDARTFLDQVCRKAGLPMTAWLSPDAKLQRFEGRMISGSLKSSPPSSATPSRLLTPEQLTALGQFARANISAQQQGAVPQCFPPGLPDLEVSGLALIVRHESGQNVVFSRMQLRGTLPLQMTLLQLTQNAAQWLQQDRAGQGHVQDSKTGILVLNQPTLHGTLAEPDLRGIDPAQQAILLQDGRHHVLLFDPQLSGEQLMQDAQKTLQAGLSNAVQIVAFTASGSDDRVLQCSRPEPQPGPAKRPAAVAGTFYPSDPAALRRVVDDCLADIPLEKERWCAIMVPHAGLKYSGRIAADVWKRVEIPGSVIILGPKHTPHGVDLALAPHRTWLSPGATIETDAALTNLLANRLTGLQFDAAAHAQEHAIEVELPFLSRLNCDAKLTAILIGGQQTLERCLSLGKELAAVLESLPELPLLVISSDMNHFASDSENRRLDEMALQAMETRDPVALFNSVRQNSISMCGVLPAIIVMEALRCLNRLDRIERVSYATSADVTGDRTRVVGYAGMLLGSRSSE